MLLSYRKNGYSHPCPGCEVEEKILLNNREKFPIDPYHDRVDEISARCIFYCPDLVLNKLKPHELAYANRIGRLTVNPHYKPSNIEELRQRVTTSSREQIAVSVK